MDILVTRSIDRITWRPVAVVSSMAMIGFIACQFASTYVLTTAVVVAWGLCRSRWTAYGLLIVYSLTSTWVVVPAIVDYLQWHSAQALLFWAVALPITLLPWLVLHRSDTKFVELRLGLILLFTVMPPVGFVQFASPFVGTSMLLAGLGWVSIAAGLLLCGGLIRLYRSGLVLWMLPVLFCVLVSNVLLVKPQDIEGWKALDTAVKVGGFEHTIEGSMQALLMARKTARSEKPSVVVLGESTGGYSLSGGAMLLGSVLNNTVVVAGGRVDNKQSLFVWSAEGSSNVYHQRLRPVLLEHMDGDLDGIKTFDINGVRVAPLICYEGAVPYTLVTALADQPEAILAIANFSWSGNDAYFERVLRAHIGAWGMIFNVPTLVAVNSRSAANV